MATTGTGLDINVTLRAIDQTAAAILSADERLAGFAKRQLERLATLERASTLAATRFMTSVGQMGDAVERGVRESSTAIEGTMDAAGKRVVTKAKANADAVLEAWRKSIAAPVVSETAGGFQGSAADLARARAESRAEAQRELEIAAEIGRRNEEKLEAQRRLAAAEQAQNAARTTAVSVETTLTERERQQLAIQEQQEAVARRLAEIEARRAVLRGSDVAGAATLPGRAGRAGRFGLLAQTGIYTASDLVASLGSGISPTRIALQQGPQVAQAIAMAGVPLAVIGAVAAKLALIAVAAAPLIFALTRLAQVVRTNSENIANLSGTNRRTGEVIQEGVEGRRREGRLTNEQAQEFQARARAIREQQARFEAGPSPLRASLGTFLGGGDPIKLFAERQAAQEREQLEILEANRKLFRDINEAESASHSARASMAIAAEENRVAMARNARELELNALNDRMAEVLASEFNGQEERVRVLSEFYAAAVRASEENEQDMASLSRLRIREIDAELERTRFNTDEYWGLMRERAEIEAQLTMATAAAAAERAKLRRDERLGTDEEVRRERERLREEALRRIGGDFRSGRVAKFSEMNRLADQGILRKEDRPEGPDPENFGQQAEYQLVQYQNALGTFAENAAIVMASPLQGFHNGLTNALDEMLEKGGTVGDMFSNIAVSLGATMRRAFAQMVSDWIMTHVVMKGVAIAYEAFLKVLRWTGVLDANAAETAKTPALAANATLASIGSYGVAVAIGLAAIAGILAATGAFNEGGLVPGGGPDRDSVLARLTPGEVVIPRREVQRRGAAYFLNNYVNGGGRMADPATIASYNRGGVVSGMDFGGRDVAIYMFDSRAAANQAASQSDVDAVVIDAAQRNVHKL